MTKEEAIERVRERIDNMAWCIDDEDKEALETLIPELKESKDEKIRKFIRSLLENARAAQSNTALYKEYDDALSWLEKQKINTEGDFARGYDCGYECCLNSHGAEWFEKQKEQKFLNISTASEWLRERVHHYMNSEYNEFHKCIEYDGSIDKERLINDFEEAMQKEQKPLSTEEIELNSLAFLEQMGYTCIPPKKEHQNNSGAPKKALGRALNSPLDKDKNLDDIAQDYVEAVKEYNPEPTWDLMQTAVCYGYHYREEEEQKPASGNSEKPNNQWNEEDERMLRTIISDGSRGVELDTKQISWLKSLRSRPKVSDNWKPSEEQMNALKEASASWMNKEMGNCELLESLFQDLKKL